MVGIEQQVVHERRHPGRGPARDLPGGPKILRVGIRVGHDNLQIGVHDRQRIPQFVRRLLHEPSLVLKGTVQAGQHVVERVSQIAQLVRGPTQVNALRQVGGRDLPGNRRDPADRPEN